MQTIPLNLTAANKALQFNVSGDAIYFESVSNAPVDGRIIVTNENGIELTLKAGQSYRDKKPSGRWFVKSYDGSSTITGVIIIGSGEFNDNNIQISSVAISNEVEVKNDTGKPLSVSNAQAYSNHFIGAFVANQAENIVTAASNTNGIIIHRAFLSVPASMPNGSLVILTAKSTAPATYYDGDKLTAIRGNGTGFVDKDVDVNIRLPAGVGVWLFPQSSDGAGGMLKASIFYSLL